MTVALEPCFRRFRQITPNPEPTGILNLPALYFLETGFFMTERDGKETCFDPLGGSRENEGERCEMPYQRLTELPKQVRDNLPKHAQEIYKEAYNSAWAQYDEPEERRDDTSREETACCKNF